MWARITQNSLRMPGIRLQVIYPERPNYRSVLIFGEAVYEGLSPSRAGGDLQTEPAGVARHFIAVVVVHDAVALLLVRSACD